MFSQKLKQRLFHRKEGNENQNVSYPWSAFLSASGICLKRCFVYDVTGAELLNPFIWSVFLVLVGRRQINQFDASWEDPLDVKCCYLPRKLFTLINI